VSRHYARNNAEAARLGVPTYYQARRSKEAAERRGLAQSVVRGHARPGGVASRRYAKSKAEAARLGVPTYYQARRAAS